MGLAALRLAPYYACTCRGDYDCPGDACPTTAAADRVDQKEVDRTIARGLDWLASRQSERDGHWIAPGGMYPTAITAMSATALLSEGSTTMQGKYASNIRKAVDYLVDRASHNRNGLIGRPRRRPLYLWPRLLHAFPLASLGRRRGRRPPQRAGRSADQRRHVHGPGPDQGRRLGLCQRQGRRRLRRRLDHHHAGPRAPRLPQCRHPRAQGNHRQRREIHPQLHRFRRRRGLQHAHGGGAAAAGRPSPPRPSPACSTLATTTTNSCPSS